MPERGFDTGGPTLADVGETSPAPGARRDRPEPRRPSLASAPATMPPCGRPSPGATSPSARMPWWRASISADRGSARAVSGARAHDRRALRPRRHGRPAGVVRGDPLRPVEHVLRGRPRDPAGSLRRRRAAGMRGRRRRRQRHRRAAGHRRLGRAGRWSRARRCAATAAAAGDAGPGHRDARTSGRRPAPAPRRWR